MFRHFFLAFCIIKAKVFESKLYLLSNNEQFCCVKSFNVFNLELFNWPSPAYFWKSGHSRSLFPYFSLFFTVPMFIDVPMTGFELRTSGVGSDRSSKGATTTVLSPDSFFIYFRSFQREQNFKQLIKVKNDLDSFCQLGLKLATY